MQDPNTVYAGANTICISPSANYTGCPSGAARQTGYPTAWSGKRVLLHTGETFGPIDIQDGNNSVQVSSYGSGAKPSVASAAVGNWRPGSAAFATDISVMNLDVKNGMHQTMGSRVLFYRNDVHTSGAGLSMSLGGEDYWYRVDPYRTVAQSAFYNAREIFFVENNALNTDTTSASYGIFGSGSRVALLGNTLGWQKYHSIRMTSLHRGVVAHNEAQGVSSEGIYHAIKIHSGGLNPYTDAFINNSSGEGGWASNQIVVANNLIGNASANNGWTAAICSQNPEYAEGVENVIVEDNRFVHGTGTSTDLVFGGRRLTSRGNTVTNGTRLITGAVHDRALPAEWKGPHYFE
ncbi:MAG: hypothetical protein RLZZ618_2021 [Pseudomonadota bacterium]